MKKIGDMNLMEFWAKSTLVGFIMSLPLYLIVWFVCWLVTKDDDKDDVIIDCCKTCEFDAEEETE